MKIETTVTLTQIEKEALIKRVSIMRNTCHDLQCSCTNCEGCPFDEITDRIYDVADNLAEILSKCKVEGE